MSRSRSYVLRCLPAGTTPGGRRTWRFRIQRAERDARWHAFPSLEAVAIHLRGELEWDEAGEAERADRGEGSTA